MHHNHGVLEALFSAANIVIVAGYLAVPFLVLPYLPLTRPVLLCGAGFFAGCAGTHAWMAFGTTHTTGGWYTFWTVWHVVQALCTWGFILGFRHMLKEAQGRRRDRRGPR
ncbi:hypothetical protein Ade02nite_19910 [Paractinoplanes deccanensis]|uniref:Uncharacterized protein n=1 Tax=Paractinoplanes deccanensis TaxID=113561 RepID=A0ABQ3Y0G8_9ACTN|nr:hypothetical protein [Actinoplanes deccanensis]GID73350.1 hypothetical protein Ade02nite_19910 [Actinoplanes deccanensis]